jgi:hypothetical protein
MTRQPRRLHPPPQSIVGAPVDAFIPPHHRSLDHIRAGDRGRVGRERRPREGQRRQGCRTAEKRPARDHRGTSLGGIEPGGGPGGRKGGGWPGKRTRRVPGGIASRQGGGPGIGRKRVPGGRVHHPGRRRRGLGSCGGHRIGLGPDLGKWGHKVVRSHCAICCNYDPRDLTHRRGKLIFLPSRDRRLPYAGDLSKPRLRHAKNRFANAFDLVHAGMMHMRIHNVKRLMRRCI